MKTFLGLTILLLGFLLIGLLVVGHLPVQSAAPAEPAAPVLLAMPTGIAAATGYSVTVPVAFQSGGNAVGSTTFSIDFDEGCLAFNERDGNNDGRPDAVRSNVPPAFRLSVSYNAGDTDGELDLVIADYSFPIASLPNNDALLSVSFTAHCTPAAGAIITAPVLFSQAPVASFGDANGVDVEGTTSNGSVAIQAEPLATPTPTVTVTPAPGTPSATPTITATPGPGTPSATPTATPGPGTPTATSTLVPTVGPGTPTVTPMPDEQWYLPLIQRNKPTG